MDDEDEAINLRGISRFPLLYWLLVAAYALRSMGSRPFDNIASEYFEERFGLDNETAGFLIGIPSLISIVVTPFCGWIIDRKGRKSLFRKSVHNFSHHSRRPGSYCLFLPWLRAFFQR